MIRWLHRHTHCLHAVFVKMLSFSRKAGQRKESLSMIKYSIQLAAQYLTPLQAKWTTTGMCCSGQRLCMCVWVACHHQAHTGYTRTTSLSIPFLVYLNVPLYRDNRNPLPRCTCLLRDASRYHTVNVMRFSRRVSRALKAGALENQVYMTLTL